MISKMRRLEMMVTDAPSPVELGESGFARKFGSNEKTRPKPGF